MLTAWNQMIKFFDPFCDREVAEGITGDTLHADCDAVAGLALKESLFSGYWSPCRARDWKKSFVPTQAIKGAFSCFGVQVPH